MTLQKCDLMKADIYHNQCSL